MPPRGRQPSRPREPNQRSVPDTDPTGGKLRVEPDLCGKCWPQGWPDDVYSAGCEHGSYLHHQRAAEVAERG